MDKSWTAVHGAADRHESSQAGLFKEALTKNCGDVSSFWKSEYCRATAKLRGLKTEKTKTAKECMHVAVEHAHGQRAEENEAREGFPFRFLLRLRLEVYTSSGRPKAVTYKRGGYFVLYDVLVLFRILLVNYS
ncbi:hypothetical protein R1flu_022215 [Riccia fluitans]|uniref:Uncharacterized protein n=1 Tax=Riccia fluitans TaxID=41844 RepID=A0ABD1ZS85_9MARC